MTPAVDPSALSAASLLDLAALVAVATSIACVVLPPTLRMLALDRHRWGLVIHHQAERLFPVAAWTALGLTLVEYLVA